MRARNYRSGGGADVAAARLDGGAAVAAQRAIFDLVTGYRQIQQGAGFHGKFDFAATAIDQRSGSHHAPASFLNHLNRLLRGAAGGPYVFNHQNVLIGAQRKSAAQTHDSGGIAFGKNSGNAAAAAALWLGQGARDFLADDDAAERRRHHRFDGGVRKKRSQRAAQFFRRTRILQDKRALYVRPAVQAAGELEMAVPDGAGGLEQAQQFFVLQHKSPAITRSCQADGRRL